MKRWPGETFKQCDQEWKCSLCRRRAVKAWRSSWNFCRAGERSAELLPRYKSPQGSPGNPLHQIILSKIKYNKLKGRNAFLTECSVDVPRIVTKKLRTLELQ